VGNKSLSGGITNVTAPATTAPRKDVQPGGTITYLKVADVQGYDPTLIANSGNSDGGVAFMVFDMLAYSDPADGQVKPQTAQSLTSSDAIVWTLKLRPNIKFSDGTPYDAAAVKFNWARLADPANAATRAAQAQLIQSMDVIDAQTLKITLKAKNAVFPQAVALIPFIASPTALQAKGANFRSEPVGAGPFTLKSWVRDSQAIFQRNPNYWNAPLPYVDQVIAKPIADDSQRINTFKSGDANLIYVNVSQSAQQAQAAGGVPYPAIINGGTNIFFNTRKAPFNDVRARQAITYAIDRGEMSKLMDNGVLPTQDSVFRKESPFYDPNITQLPYDPKKAQQLFDQLAADTGGPLTFTLVSFNTGNYLTAAQYLQGKLGSYNNVKVTIDYAASAAQQARVNKGDFTAALYSQPFDDPEPIWTSIFTCGAAASPTGWCDSRFDSLVVGQREALDGATRVADLKEAQKIFYDQVPSMYFQRRAAWLFSIPAMQDLQWVNDGLPMFDRMWLKSK
jgi:peptide/nickel transport system substrate-binding protein